MLLKITNIYSTINNKNLVICVSLCILTICVFHWMQSTGCIVESWWLWIRYYIVHFAFAEEAGSFVLLMGTFNTVDVA